MSIGHGVYEEMDRVSFEKHIDSLRYDELLQVYFRSGFSVNMSMKDKVMYLYDQGLLSPTTKSE